METFYHQKRCPTTYFKVSKIKNVTEMCCNHERSTDPETQRSDIMEDPKILHLVSISISVLDRQKGPQGC